VSVKVDDADRAGSLQGYPRRKVALIVLFLASFMDLLDTTIVNVALPPIQRELSAGYSAVQWVVAGYALAFALLLITGGRLGDIVGRKRMFLIGVAGFTIASATCGAAQSPGMLVASRVLQGALAAMMVPQVLSIIQVMFPPKERGAAMGGFAGLAGLATVAGPVLGAVLTEGDLFGLGWRAVFLINVPVGIGTLIAASLLVPESKAPTALKLDLPGVLIVTAGLGLLLYPLVQGRDLGWPAWTFVAMVLSVPVLVGFVYYQRWRQRRDGSPLVALNLFKHRSYSAGNLVSLVFFAVMGSYFLVFTLFLQQGLGYSVLRAGLTGLPWSVSTPLFAGIGAAVLTPKFGRAVLAAGALIMAAGIALIIVTVSRYGPDLHPWQLIPALFIGGAGMGMVLAPVFDFVLSDVPEEDAGSASGVFSATEQVGFAAGIALIGVLFFGLLGHSADRGVDAALPQLHASLSAAGVPAGPAQDQIAVGFRTCVNDIMHAADPAVLPPSCASAGATDGVDAAALQRATEQAGNTARAAAFIDAVRLTFAVSVAALLLTFGLIFLLPRRPTHHEVVH
jgi:EmrB/QacA subfamily drug resistance transporter